jgi:hypothetical protein
MIKRIQSKDQTTYHRQKFNKLVLPNVYDAGPISASLISELKNPMVFLMDKGKSESEDMKWGSLVDMLWLTPEDFDKHFVVLPDNAPKKPTIAQRRAKKPTPAALDLISWWDRFESKSLGKTIIDPLIFKAAKKAIEMLNAHPISRNIFENSEKQVILNGQSDKLHPSKKPLKAKAMMDLLPLTGTISVGGQSINLNECVVDLKQCHDTSAYGIKKAIRTFEYHIKTAWYLNMLRASGEEKRNKAILIFQNSKPPHDVHVRIICEEDLNWAEFEIVRRLDLLSQINPNDISNLYDLEVEEVSAFYKS